MQTCTMFLMAGRKTSAGGVALSYSGGSDWQGRKYVYVYRNPHVKYVYRNPHVKGGEKKRRYCSFAYDKNLKSKINKMY